jgi:sensor histidine kinase YesM
MHDVAQIPDRRSWIRIQTSMQAGYLNIQISDNGMGMQKKHKTESLRIYLP